MNAKVAKYSVGIDVSRPELEVCFKEMSADQATKVKGSRKFPNTPGGFRQLHQWIGKRRRDGSVPLAVVMEATGVYHERLAHYLHQQGYTLSVVLPSRSSDYRKSLGYKSKTDKIDGKGLAQMGAERQLRPWTPPTGQMLEMRALCRYKDTLEKAKTRFRNRLHAQHCSAHASPLVIKLLEDQIKCLDGQIKEVGSALGRLVGQRGSLGDRIRKVAGSIKGAGVASLASIVAETNGFELFGSAGQLASYAGYDVVENQSGSRRGRTRMSKKGNSHIRKALHFPALNVVRHGIETFSGLYERVYERTGIKMKGYVAVQRKLLCMVYILWKKDEAFDPGFRQKQERENQRVPALPAAPI